MPDRPCECPEVWVCRADPELAEERRLERLRQQQEKERAQTQARDAEQQRALREAEAAKRRAQEAEELRRAQEAPPPAATTVAPAVKAPVEVQPVRPAARCRAGAGYCCLEDGTVIRPCGPIGRPGCSQYTSMCGSGGFCHGCRCLPPDTLVLTPTGEVALSRLQVGDAIVTLTSAGTRSVARVLRVARDPLMGSHQMVVVRLENGRTLVGSAPHPLADGRTWTRISDLGYHALDCAHDGSCWAAGGDGRVARLVP